jgi:hypothetical protein
MWTLKLCSFNLCVFMYWSLQNVTRCRSYCIQLWFTFLLTELSDNRETRRHNLLIRSILFFISCMAFMLEMLQLQRGNTSIGIRISDKSRVSMRKVHSHHQHMSAITHAMCITHNTEEVSDAVHVNPLTSIRYITCEIDLCQGAVLPAWGMVVCFS